MAEGLLFFFNSVSDVSSSKELSSSPLVPTAERSFYASTGEIDAKNMRGLCPSMIFGGPGNERALHGRKIQYEKGTAARQLFSDLHTSSASASELQPVTSSRSITPAVYQHAPHASHAPHGSLSLVASRAKPRTRDKSGKAKCKADALRSSLGLRTPPPTSVRSMGMMTSKKPAALRQPLLQVRGWGALTLHVVLICLMSALAFRCWLRLLSS